MIIRQALPSSDRTRIFQFRYEIYVEEMDRPQGDADHRLRQIRDSLDDTGHLFMAEDHGELVGTIRINFRREGPLEHENLYDIDRFERAFPGAISMTTRLMVRRSHRGSTVAAKLAMAVYEHARKAGIQFDFIDCNPHLVRLYQQLGHRIYRSTIRHPDYGTVIPMVMATEDTDHFARVRSPFRRIQRKFENSRASGEFFSHEFSRFARIEPSFLLSSEELFETWGRNLLRGEGR